MKYKKQRNIKYAVMFVIIGGLLAFFASEELTGNPNLGAGKTFSLPELRYVGSDRSSGNSNDSNVSCDIKQTLYVSNQKGEIIATVQSSMLDDAIPFDLVNPSDDDPVKVFVAIPKIFCTTDNESITVKESNLNLSVYGTTETIKESKTQKLNQKYSTKGGYENQLGYFSVSDKTIEKNLPEYRTFQSQLKFDITGNVEIIYDNDPSNVMTIPINTNDITAKWNYKSLADKVAVTDSDNDGIDDKYDRCPNQRETHNNYNDGDGCPDQVPNTTPSTPTAPITPVDKNSCNAQQKTWYITNYGAGVCSNKFTTSDGQFCKEYDASKGQQSSCIDPKPISSDISAQVKFQIKVDMAGGGTQALEATDDPNPFDVSIPLSLLGNSEIIGQTGAFNVEPRLVISDQQKHKLTDTKVSNLNIETFIKVKGSEYSLGKDNVNGFLPKNGGSIDQPIGFPLGSIKVSSFDIQNAIPVTIVPMGTSENVDLRFLVSGDVILSINDGNQRKNVPVDLTGADFEINNLQIVRSDASTPIQTPTPYRAPTECAVDETEQVVGDDRVCVPNTPNTKPDDLSCKDNEYVLIKDNGIPECALKTGSVEELEQCPQGTEQCVVISDNTKTSGGNPSINSFSSSDNTNNDIILYGAIGLLVLGLIAFILKRRN